MTMDDIPRAEGSHPVRYWRQDMVGELQNFGDFLSELLLARLFVLPTFSAGAYHLIGSVITEEQIRSDLCKLDLNRTKEQVAFWCCGMRGSYPLSEWALAHARFFGVRGPLTRNALGLPTETVVGDPGLLAPLLHPAPARSTRGEALCILHILDPRSSDDVLQETGADRVIRAGIPGTYKALRNFMEMLATADFVLSGALHGAIVACAYGVPFAFYDSGYIDVPFKWMDFAASVNLPCIFAKTIVEGRNIHAQHLAPAYKPRPLTPILAVAPFSLRHEMLLRAMHYDGHVTSESLAPLLTAIEALRVDDPERIAQAQAGWLERAERPHRVEQHYFSFEGSVDRWASAESSQTQLFTSCGSSVLPRIIQQNEGGARMNPVPPVLIGNGLAYEDIIARLYNELLCPGDVALDGGSGYGRDATAMALRVGESGSVIASEPIPWLAERLRLDAVRRGLPQLGVHEIALSDQSGEGQFIWVQNADAYSGLKPRRYPVSPDIREITVRLSTLDELLATEKRPWRFGKLDLQGGDFRALQGGAQAIAFHRPLLVFHNSRNDAALTYGYNADAFFDFFRELNYRLFDLFGRPFDAADWALPNLPWYTIALPSEMGKEINPLLDRILADVTHVISDPGLDDLEPWLAQQQQTDYLVTHRVRYIETWRRAAPALMAARKVIELGGLSTIGTFLAERRGIDLRLVESDLRYPYAPLDNSADAVLSLEVLEHLNDAHGPNSTIDEIAMFVGSGARNMFRESFRILKPGGCLVLTTPNGNSLDAIGNLLSRRHAFTYPPHVREYAPRDVIALAEAEGFLTEVADTFMAWYAHPDVDRAALARDLAALGFDMTGRGDDAYFLFRKPY